MVRQTQANAPMSAALATINLGAEDVHSPSLYQDMIALERSPTKRPLIPKSKMGKKPLLSVVGTLARAPGKLLLNPSIAERPRHCLTTGSPTMAGSSMFEECVVRVWVHFCLYD
ncbi:unnamed protein product [Danaus chrysippus]|uniref:(African queen) hypothetical protein n=1 Tax=Danaus chrysippus TaxID=151541 RepID=A0A8J2QZ75_9NEOP|nr:unnamed protein product [Danaus chrysippus]